MKMRRIKKLMALALTMVLVFHSGNTYAYGDEVVHITENIVEEERISSFATTTVTGSAITFYVGGSGASDAAGVTGRDSATPFATIGRAAALINNVDREVVYDTEGREVYEIIVQGNTSVPNEVFLGDSITEKVITIKGTVTGSAIVARTGSYITSMFTVTTNTSLILGDHEATDNQSLILDGYRTDSYQHPIIANIGTLILYNGVTVCNNHTPYKTGGGIRNYGIFYLNGGIIKNNRSGMGGGIFNDTGAVLYISGGTVTDNNSYNDGGGIYNLGSMIVSGGFISNNEAEAAGGGIYNQGSLIQSGGFISGNYAETVGGGIYNTSSNFSIEGGTISGNKAEEGAGIYNAAGASGLITPQIISGNIVNNGSLCNYGGGIYNNTSAVLRIYGGTITNNYVYREGGGIYNKGALELNGGNIPESDDTISFSGNTAEYGRGIYSSGSITMGGRFELPEADNIYLYGGSINLSEELSNSGLFYLYVHDSREGMRILTGNTALIAGSRNLFKLADSRLKLDEEGYTYLDAAPEYYYVGGDNAADTNTGTESAHPFETIGAAINAIGGGEGSVLIQSDLEINETLEIQSATVTIMSDGAERNITRASGFNSAIFRVSGYGILSLGNTDNDEVDDTLIINGRGTSFWGNIVYNNGISKLYNGVVLVNSNYSAVVNNGGFYMYGGSISGTVDTYSGGGVRNDGHFYMTGGVISNCNAEDGGGVYNRGTFAMSGGTISGNTAERGAGIFNYGEYNEWEGVTDESTLTIGGNSNITGNVSSVLGGGIANFGNLAMTGGTISGNTSEDGGAVYLLDNMSIDGTAAIPAGEDRRNDIYLDQRFSHVVIDTAWTWEGRAAISADAIYQGRQVLHGSPELIAAYAGRFVVGGDNPGCIVAEDGRLEFTDESMTFYVDAVSGADGNNGSATNPYGTIHKAISEIEGKIGIGSIYLQSDILLSEPEFITGSITLLCDGDALSNNSKDYYTISPGDDFERYVEGYKYIYDMFYVTGSLTLGDEGYSGDDDNPTLVFDGRGVDGIQENGSVVYNEGLMTIYPGVSMINRINFEKEEAAIIHNKGTLYMQGGTMHDNEVMSAVVWNTGNFTIAGGKIYNNKFSYTAAIYNRGNLSIQGGAINNNDGGSVVDNWNEFIMEDGVIEENNIFETVCNEGTFLFKGGNICNNTGSGHIINHGEFTLDGGNIYGNTGRMAGGVTNNGNFLMKSGSISNNNGLLAGGVYNNRTFHMSGGIITGNTTISNGSIGIAHIYTNKFIMSGEAIVTSDNVIYLYDGSDNNASIAIAGPLTGTYPSSDLMGASIIKKSPVLGAKVLASEEDYTFTEEDLAYFRLADDSYAINLEGNIGWNFLNADTEISYSPMYYDGTEKHVDSVTVTFGTDTLIEGMDYEVTYKDNIHAGDQAAAIIRGIGLYAGKQIKNFTILTQTVENIITAEPEGLTRRASDGLNELQLAAWIPCTEISVALLGSDKTCISPISWVWDTAEDSYDEYGVKGGTYRFKAQFDNPSLNFGSMLFNTSVTVEPSVLVSPTFTDIAVRIGVDNAATATELGVGVLPTSGTYIWTDGDTNTSLDFCIVWDNGQTLDRTNLEAETTFTGTLTYDSGDIPEWATLPGNFRVSRTVGVTAKDVVEITGVSIAHKTYDGNPVSLIGAPTNIAGYSGSYEYRFIRTNILGYDSVQAPKEVGVYVLTISIPEEDENYTGYIEITFVINYPRYTTSTPAPTPAPEIEIISDFVELGEGMGRMQVIITQLDKEGNLQVDFLLPEEDLLELLLDNTSGKPIPLSISMTSEKLIELIREVEGGQVSLNLVIPASIRLGDFDISDIILDPELLKAVKEFGKDIIFSFKDEKDNILYSWTFLGVDLENSGDIDGPDQVNLALSVGRITDRDELNELLKPGIDGDDQDTAGVVIDFNHIGLLPAQSAVRVYVGDLKGLEPGDKIYLYYRDPVTGKLATLPYSSGMVVDKDGYVTVHIIHCSEYILLPKAADQKLVASLRNQIGASPLKVTLYTDRTDKLEAEIKIKLPDTLQIVKKFDAKKAGKAVGAVTVSYRSGNKKIATVDKKGIIHAVGTGKTMIYVKFTLYSGKTKTLGIKVTVKKEKRNK